MISYDYINDYIRKTIKRNKGILMELESFAEAQHIPIIQPEVAQLLLVLGRLKKPRRILEVGTAIGYSAIFNFSRFPAGASSSTFRICISLLITYCNTISYG
jgi:predicted O-methyltransferase YrrM